MCGYQRRWLGELDEGCQKVQTFSYKINKYQDCKAQYYCMLYRKAVKSKS